MYGGLHVAKTRSTSCMATLSLRTPPRPDWKDFVRLGKFCAAFHRFHYPQKSVSSGNLEWISCGFQGPTIGTTVPNEQLISNIGWWPVPSSGKIRFATK